MGSKQRLPITVPTTRSSAATTLTTMRTSATASRMIARAETRGASDRSPQFRGSAAGRHCGSRRARVQLILAPTNMARANRQCRFPAPAATPYRSAKVGEPCSCLHPVLRDKSLPDLALMVDCAEIASLSLTLTKPKMPAPLRNSRPEIGPKRENRSGGCQGPFNRPSIRSGSTDATSRQAAPYQRSRALIASASLAVALWAPAWFKCDQFANNSSRGARSPLSMTGPYCFRKSRSLTVLAPLNCGT